MNEEKAKQRARDLRKNMTDAERMLWQKLRNRQLKGYKFRRQKPVGPYIVDFICPEKMLIVEIDGGQHAVQKEEDAKRTAYLMKENYRVIRFWNNAVLTECRAVMSRILDALESDR